MGATFDGTAAVVEQSGAGRPFWGDWSLDPDLEASWTGSVNNSESVLSGRSVAGYTAVGAAAVQSGQWSV